MKDTYQILTLDKKGITDFALERNNLLKSAKSEWVFFVDSDEEVSKSLEVEINQAVGNNNFDCYTVIRKNYFLGNYVGSDKIIRLVKKGGGKWERRVHEVWKSTSGKAGTLEKPLIHNTANNLKDYIAKINFYSGLHAKANIEEGKKATLFKIIFYPPLKFVVTLVKSKNMVFSIMQSLHSFLSWAKQWELQKD